MLKYCATVLTLFMVICRVFETIRLYNSTWSWYLSVCVYAKAISFTLTARLESIDFKQFSHLYHATSFVVLLSAKSIQTIDIHFNGLTIFLSNYSWEPKRLQLETTQTRQQRMLYIYVWMVLLVCLFEYRFGIIIHSLWKIDRKKTNYWVSPQKYHSIYEIFCFPIENQIILKWF